ncbi:MAG: lipopolysaccharide biosynthesis protein [Flavobacteriaceae bacterium]|nr:lipopolysaccharide biosynthesis protein [Flavobacteriaceae bacterium]
MNLKKKTAKGLIWSSINSIGLQFISFIFAVILARLLDPSDFGLIALLTLFISVSETMAQGGFIQALIQKAEVTNEDYSTVFLFNLLISFVFYGIIFFSSPFIAVFFEQPSLDIITKVISLVIIFNSLGIIQDVALKRALNFKTLTLINLVSMIISSLIAVILAYIGFGVWSLVIKTILYSFFVTILLWLSSRLKPSLKFSIYSFKENFYFGYKIMIANVINIISSNAINVLIGKFYSIEALGLFFKGDSLSKKFSRFVYMTFNNVSFPVLSSLKDDESKLQQTYIRFMRASAFLSFPLMMLIIVIAKPLIIVLLTEKWSGSIEFLQILSINGMFMPLIVISGLITLVKGRSDYYLKLEIVYKIQLITTLIITVSMGVKAMAIGTVLQIITQFFINLVIVNRLVSISFLKQILSLKNIFFTSAGVAILTYFIKYIIFSDIFLLISQIIFFIVCYLSIQYFFKSKELAEIRIIFIKQILTKFK